MYFPKKLRICFHYTKAAVLAAENSKAKTQKLVSVLCVERKFVVKPKNARPGEVSVLKDTAVDAILG